MQTDLALQCGPKTRALTMLPHQDNPIRHFSHPATRKHTFQTIAQLLAARIEDAENAVPRRQHAEPRNHDNHDAEQEIAGQVETARADEAP